MSAADRYPPSGDPRATLASTRPGLESVIDLRDRTSGMDTFYALVAATDDGIMVVDQRGIIRFANRAAEKLLDQGTESLIGRNFGLPLSDDDVEVELVNSKGTNERRRRVAEVRVVDTDWRGESCKLVSVRDITERKRTEEALRRSEDQFRSLATSSPLGIFSASIYGQLTYVNPQLIESVGPRASRGLVNNLVVDSERARLDELVHTAASGETTEALDFECVLASGNRGYLRIRIGPTFDAFGNVRGLVGTVADVTAHTEAVHAIERLSSVIEATTDIVAITTPDGELQYLNGAARAFLGFNDDRDLVGRKLQDIYPAWARSRYRNTVIPELTSNNMWSGDMAIVDRTGKEVAVSQVSIAHRSADNHIQFISTIARDITETKELAQRLEYQALHDALTGLPNRSLFLDRLESALARLVRHPGYLGVLFLDLDRFKTVNDTLGHASGDQLIIEVAARLADVLRPGDTVARFAGDEFVILCEDLTSRRQGERIAARVVESMAQPFKIEGSELFLSGSVGIVLTDDGAQTPDAVLRSADAAMYQAKDRGKNRFEVYDEQMRARTEERAHLEHGLHRAYENGEFFCEYQPEYDLRTNKLVAFEALARWNHPERGRLGPDEFIPIAEETGLILEVGEWVLREACTQAEALQHLDNAADKVEIAVNLSGRQLAHPDIVRVINDILIETSVDPSLIAIEVTESVLMHDLDATIRKLAALRALGIAVGIDDFGTGYSSLAHLKAFPVEFLKIDRTFVRGLGRDENDSKIASAIVGLASSLGLRSIAEGIETEEQRDELNRLGCDIGQGWLLGPPRPIEALIGG